MATVSSSGEITAKAVGSTVISIVDEDSNVIHISISVVTLLGDCNLDEKVDKTDISILTKYLTAGQHPDMKEWKNVDMDRNGTLNATDLSLLKRKYASE